MSSMSSGSQWFAAKALLQVHLAFIILKSSLVEQLVWKWRNVLIHLSLVVEKYNYLGLFDMDHNT